MPIIFGSLKETGKVFVRDRVRAFKNAIENNYLSENNTNECFGCANCNFCEGNYQGNFEYIETVGKTDYFQNIYTRKYITVGFK